MPNDPFLITDYYMYSHRSTIFLNIHWFLDKTGRTGTTLQLINGFLLLATFFVVRIVMGGKMVSCLC